MRATDSNAPSPQTSAWTRRAILGIGSIAMLAIAVHVATNGQYGFHRDELYYLDSARHLAFGYVDYPPITPLIARLSLWLFGPSVSGLRLWPTLAGGVMVALAAMIARELGGGRVARMLATVGAASSLVLLGANWLFQTVTFDQLGWLVCIWLTARLVRTGDRRLWLGLGAAIGVGVETKYTILSLVAGLLAGIAMTPLRRDLRTRWPWMGLGAAVLILLPNLAWQIANGWPSLAYTFNHHAAQSIDFAPLSFIGDQLSLIGPLAIPVWVTGLWWLLAGAGRRVIGIAAAVAVAIFLVVGKGYYIGPLDPALLAAGACAIERWTAERRRWLRPATAAALTLQAVVLLPIAIPLVQEATMARSSLASIRTDFADTVGWDALVHEVASVYDRVSPGQRAATLILTNNYGEAGALNTLGPRLGLPDAHSGELTYFYWRPASLAGPVLAVGFDLAFLNTLFRGCSQVATVTNRYGLRNQEFGAPIALCTASKLPLDELWPRLKTFQ